MYRITHGAYSILKLKRKHVAKYMYIKAVDFMRGMKRKFIHFVDSFKLNANAVPRLLHTTLSTVPNTNSVLQTVCLDLLKLKYLGDIRAGAYC